MRKFQIIRWILIGILILLLFGICYTTVIPQCSIWYAEKQQERVALTWLEEVRVNVPSIPSTDTSTDVPVESTPSEDSPVVESDIRYDDLYNDVLRFNNHLRDNGQSGLRDVFDYESPMFDLSDYGVVDDVFGAISIPRINVVLPLYLGATYRHMAGGFAQMSNTSIPIGGADTNSVIACHRGWNRMSYLRDVEMIQIGDSVFVHNFWADLEYRVVDIYVVEPSDLSILEIQDGRDLITLFTCHPYGKSTHRYVVVCERYISDTVFDNQNESDLMSSDDIKSNISEHEDEYVTQVIQSVMITTTSTSDGNVESSQQILFWTVYFPWLLLFVLMSLIFVVFCYRLLRRLFLRRKTKTIVLPVNQRKDFSGYGEHKS